MKEEWKDIGIIATFQNNTYSVDFDCYEITGQGQDTNGDFNVNIYERKGATSSEDETKNINEAQTLFRGSVKWDGCSHVTFGDEEGYIHLCGKYNWLSLQEALSRVYKKAGEIMGDIADKEEFDK